MKLNEDTLQQEIDRILRELHKLQGEINRMEKRKEGVLTQYYNRLNQYKKIMGRDYIRPLNAADIYSSQDLL